MASDSYLFLGNGRAVLDDFLDALKAFSSEYSNTTVGLLVMIPYLLGLPVMILSAEARIKALILVAFLGLT